MAWILNRIAVTGGTYRGFLTGEGTPPPLELALGETVLGPMTCTQSSDGWHIEGQIGLTPLTDGTHTIVVRSAEGDVLDSITTITGLDAAQDLRAELSTLRAEIGILKAAVRGLSRSDSEN